MRHQQVVGVRGRCIVRPKGHRKIKWVILDQWSRVTIAVGLDGKQIAAFRQPEVVECPGQPHARRRGIGRGRHDVAAQE